MPLPASAWTPRRSACPDRFRWESPVHRRFPRFPVVATPGKCQEWPGGVTDVTTPRPPPVAAAASKDVRGRTSTGFDSPVTASRAQPWARSTCPCPRNALVPRALLLDGFRLARHGFASSAVGSLNLPSPTQRAGSSRAAARRVSTRPSRLRELSRGLAQPALAHATRWFLARCCSTGFDSPVTASRAQPWARSTCPRPRNALVPRALLLGQISVPALVSTARRICSISSKCSWSQISGGASWTTGSPRSSARQ